jgi:hypothetical protein
MPALEKVVEVYPQKLSRELHGHADFRRAASQRANCAAVGDRPEISDCAAAASSFVIVTSATGKYGKGLM